VAVVGQLGGLQPAHPCPRSPDDVSLADRLGVDEARLREVCHRYGVGRLLVFGSVARGSASSTSDIDVLYELERGRQLGWEIEDLADELADVLGRPVDLVSTSAVHRRLESTVLAQAQPLYATRAAPSRGDGSGS
jgi:uncharacterized protein